MEIKVERAWKRATYTVGKFFIDNIRFGDSMEDADRNLSADMPLSEIKSCKVYGETAIPKGRYEVKMTFSAKFAKRSWAVPEKGMVPEICNVPGFSGVRIHPLNCAADSLGCIGVGRNDRKGWISQSQAYYRQLVENHILPAIKRGEKIYITIE